MRKTASLFTSFTSAARAGTCAFHNFFSASPRNEIQTEELFGGSASRGAQTLAMEGGVDGLTPAQVHLILGDGCGPPRQSIMPLQESSRWVLLQAYDACHCAKGTGRARAHHMRQPTCALEHVWPSEVLTPVLRLKATIDLYKGLTGDACEMYDALAAEAINTAQQRDYALRTPGLWDDPKLQRWLAAPPLHKGGRMMRDDLTWRQPDERWKTPQTGSPTPRARSRSPMSVPRPPAWAGVEPTSPVAGYASPIYTPLQPQPSSARRVSTPPPRSVQTRPPSASPRSVTFDDGAQYRTPSRHSASTRASHPNGGPCPTCQQRLGAHTSPTCSFAGRRASLPLDVPRVADVFDRLSESGAGVLNRSHLLCALHLCGVDASAPYAKKVLEAYMTSHAAKGVLNRGEFAALVQQITAGPNSLDSGQRTTGGGGSTTQPTSRIALDDAKAATKSATASLTAAMNEAEAARKRRAWHNQAEANELLAAAEKAQEWDGLQRALQAEQDALRLAQETTDLANGIRRSNQQNLFVDPEAGRWSGRSSDNAARSRRDPAARAKDRRMEHARAAAEREAARREATAREAERQNAERWAAFERAAFSAQQDRPSVATPEGQAASRAALSPEATSTTTALSSAADQRRTADAVDEPDKQTEAEKSLDNTVAETRQVLQLAGGDNETPGAAKEAQKSAATTEAMVGDAARVAARRVQGTPGDPDSEAAAAAVGEEASEATAAATGAEASAAAAAGAEAGAAATKEAADATSTEAGVESSTITINGQAPDGHGAYAKGYRDGQAGIPYDPIPGELSADAVSTDVSDPALGSDPSQAGVNKEGEDVAEEAVTTAPVEDEEAVVEDKGVMAVTTRFVFFPEESEAKAKELGKAWPAIEGAWDPKGARSYDWIG